MENIWYIYMEEFNIDYAILCAKMFGIHAASSVWYKIGLKSEGIKQHNEIH